MNGSAQGYAAYKVGDAVTTHAAWGLGSYCYFRAHPELSLSNAFEVPTAHGIRLHDMTTVSLNGKNNISHIVNGTGNSTKAGNATLSKFP